MKARKNFAYLMWVLEQEALQAVRAGEPTETLRAW